jgi:transcriptional regulator
MGEADELAKIMQLRALGWSQRDIAREVGASEASVSYHLRRIRERSRREGVNVFWEIMAASAVRWLNEKMMKLEQLGI